MKQLQILYRKRIKNVLLQQPAILKGINFIDFDDFVGKKTPQDAFQAFHASSSFSLWFIPVYNTIYFWKNYDSEDENPQQQGLEIPYFQFWAVKLLYFWA